MNPKHRLLNALSIVVILTMMLSSIHLPTASAQGSDGIQRDYNAESGKVTRITGAGDEPIELMGAMSSDMTSTERSDVLIEEFAPEFGLVEPSEELVVADESQPESDRVVTKYQQVYEGVPVMGGELIVNASNTGALYSMNGEVAQGLSLSTQPEISAAQAKQIAVEAMAKWNGKTPGDFIVTEPALWIFDESLLQPSIRPATLVWRMDVTFVDDSLPIRELILINAQTGNPDFHFNQADTAWNPKEGSQLVQKPAATLLGNAWYVAVTGSDLNNCSSTATPCATINAAIAKAASGDTIYIATGTYTSNVSPVVTISRSVTLSGGWDVGFAVQNGQTVIDGQNTRQNVVVNSSVDTTLSSLTIRNGYASQGAGIYNQARLTLTNVAIVNNKSYNDGAGIYHNGTQLKLRNVTISNNVAKTAGGGLSVNSGSTAINNSTITQNVATSADGQAMGGGISNHLGHPFSFVNTIIAGNSSESIPDCRGQFTSSGYNLIGFDDGCLFTPQPSDKIGTWGSPLNAMLGNLMDNGGGTLTHALLPGSPAIDAGNPTTNLGDLAACQVTDQRQVTRPQGTTCDIGAFEGSSLQTVNAVIKTYTANNQTILPGTFVCDQTDPTCTAGDEDSKYVHNYALQVHDFYKLHHNRQSIDDNNLPIVSTVHYCSLKACPYYNAYWNGAQMIYGTGFAAADDIIAHELTHGVTGYESNLLYFYQSGAINESFSDLWGEYFDQTNAGGIDTEDVRWLIGEDIVNLGAIRSMKNPPQFGDPDRMTSSLYNKKPWTDKNWNNGGIDTNSGVNNKAVYLLVDGGAFNGKTVTALGWEKTGAIYYEAQTNLLTSGSDYSDLYFALQQACMNLTGEYGITPEDCVEVKDAVSAVEMNVLPTNNFSPDTALCPPGMTTDESLNLYKEDFENYNRSNWSVDGPWILDDIYASSPIHHIWGVDDADNLYAWMQTKTEIMLPAGTTPYLYFRHAFAFEHFGTEYWDGGKLFYSAAGGNLQGDAKDLFAGGQNYKGTLIKYSQGSAFGGQSAFVGDSHGYVSSLYNLSSFAGTNVNFKWAFGTDMTYNYYGWFIDDIQINICKKIPTIPLSPIPAENALITNYAPLLNWSDSSPVPQHYQIQVDDTSDFSSTLYDDSTLTTSEYQLPVPLSSNSIYYWRVRSFNDLGVTNDWSPAWSFRTALPPPTLVSPADAFSSTELRPNFMWNAVAGATGYTLQISRDNTFTQIIHSGNLTNTSYISTVDLPRGVPLYWRVLTKGTNGPSAPSEVRTFTTPSSPPPAPTLKSPVNKALFTSYTNPVLKWNQVAFADASFKHYQVQMADNVGFAGPIVDDITVTNRLTTQLATNLTLTPNTTYYWRVRTVNSSNEAGNWSIVWSVRAAMLAPALTVPEDMLALKELRPLFDWDEPNGPGAILGYTIQISKNNTFTQIVQTGNPVSSFYSPTADLPKNTTLYWRVLAKGANGPSLYSGSRSFTTPIAPPLIPTLLTPVANALVPVTKPTFAWRVGGSTPDHYIIQVDDNADFSSPVIDDTVITPNHTPNNDLTVNTKYYWRVRAVNAASELSTWSIVRVLRLSMLAPTLTAPADSFASKELRPLFDWDAPGGPGVISSYTIQFSKNETFTQIVHTGSPIGSEYIPTVDLPKNTTLHWRVLAKGTNGPSSYSAVRSLTTPVNPPPTVSVVAPAESALLTTYANPVFQWKPVTFVDAAFKYYQVQLSDDPAFSNLILNDTMITSRSTRQLVTTLTLIPNTTYYWRMRAVNTSDENGNWSLVRTLRSAILPPNLLLPTDLAGGVSRKPLLDWENVPGNTGYVLQIWKKGSTPVLVKTVTLATDVSQYQFISGLAGNTAYFWKVQTKAFNGPSLWSDRFDLITAP